MVNAGDLKSLGRKIFWVRVPDAPVSKQKHTKESLQQLLATTKDNVEVAEVLGVSKQRIFTLLKRFGLKREKKITFAQRYKQSNETLTAKDAAVKFNVSLAAVRKSGYNNDLKFITNQSINDKEFIETYKGMPIVEIAKKSGRRWSSIHATLKRINAQTKTNQ